MEDTTSPTRKQARENPVKLAAIRADAVERSGDMAPTSVETAHDAASSVGLKIDDVASHIGRKTEDAVSYAGHKAEDAVSYAGHKVEDAASYVGQRTKDASAAVGSGLRSLGQSVRDQGGMAGEASSAVADTLESSGRYLQEEKLKDIAEDVTTLIRNNPISTLLIGVAAGYLFGRVMTPRS